MNNTLLDECFDYYKELEREFFELGRYVAIDDYNFLTYSLKYLSMLQTISSEVDVVLKSICRFLGDKDSKKISQYKAVICNSFPSLLLMEVKVNGVDNTFNPWKEWESEDSPKWWSINNKVKHHRTEINTEKGIANYKLANLENVLKALSGLYVMEWYLLYVFEDDSIENIIDYKSNIGKRLYHSKISVVNFKYLVKSFIGEIFDYGLFSKVIEGKE